MNKKFFNVMSKAAMSSMFIAVLSTPVSAKICGYAIKDADGVTYRYNLTDLEDSIVLDKVLFNDYVANLQKPGITSLVMDDKTGSYVKEAAIVDEIVLNKDANLDEFVEKAEGSNLEKVDKINDVKVEDGKIVNKPVENKIEIKSVQAITTSAFSGVSTQLGFAINGETTQADFDVLKSAGYTVSYESTTAVTPDVNDSNKGTVTTTQPFEYKVIIKDKDSKVVAESAIQAVTIKNGAAFAKVTKAHLELATVGTTVGTVVVGEPNKASVKIDSYEKVDGTKEDGTVPGVTYKSSNPVAVAVDSNGKLIPLAAGKANIIISKDGMEDYSVPVTVATELRKATAIEGLSNAQLAKGATVGETKTYNLVLKDQYGDVMKGKTLTVASADTAIATVTPAGETLVDGKTSFSVTAVKAGTVNVTVKDGETLLGTAAITVKEAGAVASYGLEYDATKDTTLDLNVTDLTGDKLDNTLAVKFISRDASGLLVADLTSDQKYAITSSKPEVATIAGGTITAVGVGTTTITVKEGSLTRATLTITVINTTKPAVSALPVAAEENGDIKLTGTPFIVTDGISGTKGDKEDGDKSTITLKYNDATASEDKLGDLGVITFNMPVKVKAITLGGVELTADQMAQLVLKEKDNKNLANTYNDSFDFGPITGISVKNLVTLGDTVKVTVENESGLDNTYTITLTK